MMIDNNTAGIASLRERLAMISGQLSQLAVTAGQNIGDAVIQQLGDAAPHGQGGGSSPADDADGPLSESFSANAEEQGEGALVTVKTSQGTKLGYVVNGRGEIRPMSKRALYWEGLPHPVKYARATQPNDFVSPIINNSSDIVEPEMHLIIDELSAMLGGS